MSVSTVSNFILKPSAAVNGRFLHSPSPSVKYSLSYHSIQSARWIKLHPARSQLSSLPLCSSISSKFIVSVSHAPDWAQEEGSDALEERENLDNIEEGDGHFDWANEEQEDPGADVSNWRSEKEEFLREKEDNSYESEEHDEGVQRNIYDWDRIKSELYSSTEQGTPEEHEMSFQGFPNGSELHEENHEEVGIHTMGDNEYKMPIESEVPSWKNHVESNLFAANEEQFVTGVPAGDRNRWDKMMTEEGGERWSPSKSSQKLETSESGTLEEAKLYVGNLPYDIDSGKLAECFSVAGIVEIAEIVFNRETNQSRGFGFVTMSTEAEADKAVQILHHRQVGGRLMIVHKAFTQGSQRLRAHRAFASGYEIYCGNIPYHVDDARLHEIFSEYGKVLNVTIVNDRVTGQSRGFGFVTMSNETEQEDAIAALDGQILDGRTVRVSKAEAKPQFGINRIVGNSFGETQNGLDRFRNGLEADDGKYGQNMEYSQAQMGGSDFFNQE